jgi:SAM-dependent methyltransferase
MPSTGRLFSCFAGLHQLRFRLFGLERTQRQIIEGIRHAGILGAELLEIGCGPGYLQRTLLRLGASRATGVDLSGAMLAIARTDAAAEGLTDRTDYRQGDFTQMADQVPVADVVVLDKVICCYPDWEAMVAASLERARRVYALTIPRDRSLTRAGLGVMRWGLHRMGCCYQPFIHDPARIEERVLASGFRKIEEARTAGWLTRIYTRDGRRDDAIGDGSAKATM